VAVRVVTDSSADLPSDLANNADITVIPCNVVIDDVSYKDGVDITPDEFYQRLATSSRLPTTAQPSVADFQAVYQNLLDEGHTVVSIHVSGKLSGTVNAADQARAALSDPAAVEIVDSQLASISLGLVSLAASKRAEEGVTIAQLAQQVRDQLPRTDCMFALDTLEYLQKGGRIGRAQAFVGAILSVKPILKLQDGEAHPLERSRNMDRALRRLAELARGQAPLTQLAVVYSTESQRAQDLRKQLGDLMPEKEIIIARFGSTLGTYVGPKAFGVALTSAS